MDDRNAGLALFQAAIGMLIPFAIGYLVFRLVKPATNYWEKRPNNYGRLFLAYTLLFLIWGLGSLFFLPPGEMAGINFLILLAVAILTVGPTSYLIGYLYGKSIQKTITKKTVKQPQKLKTINNTTSDKKLDEENSEEINDEQYYLMATKEAEGLDRDNALWAKAMATQMGDENKAKAYYVNKRVLALKALKEQIRLKVYTTIERNISSNSHNPEYDLASNNLFPNSPNAHYRDKIITQFEKEVKARIEKEFKFKI